MHTAGDWVLDAGVVLDVAHEGIRTAGDEEVDVLVELQDLADVLAGFQQDEPLGGDARGGGSVAQDAEQRTVGIERLGTALEADGVTALETQRHDLRDDVGTGFEDDPDVAYRAADLIHGETVVHDDGVHGPAHRILAGDDALQGCDHLLAHMCVV